jgi:glycosyltransferase involved in cell wall biosynthesis
MKGPALPDRAAPPKAGAQGHLKLLYLSLSYIPSRRASSVHVMRMCAAFARAGHAVELVAKAAPSERDDHAFYGVAPAFALTKLARPAWRGGGVVYAAGLARVLLARRGEVDLVYSRDLIGALLATQLGMPTVFEAHGVPPQPQRFALERLFRRPSLRRVVAITAALAADLAPLLAGRQAIVAHDAADPPARVTFDRPVRARPRIGYVGNLYAGRGIELILALAARLPACDVELVGGSEADLARWRAHGLPPNVQLAGFVAPGELAARYASFDVLLLPHPRHGVSAASGGDISRWTSPMKMFEYMSSGTPIIASDLPVLGEVLRHERNALIAPADDVTAWTATVERLCADRTLARRLAEQAHADLLAHHTWDARARLVLDQLYGDA